MKIHVDESTQEVRIEWGGKHESYATVTPHVFDRFALTALKDSVRDSVTVYETPGYRVNHIDVLSPTGGFVATASSATQAQKIADALNATKED